MSIRKYKVKIAVAVGALLIATLGASVAFKQYEQYSLSRAGLACQQKQTDDQKVECWMRIITDALKQGGISSAYRVFSYLYEAFPDFGTTSCHLHAHRIGDAAYYSYFVTQGKTLEEMDFPQETTTCGYGFFHGFIEHLIQDHPQPLYVTKTCEYLRSRLSGTMHDIGTICYHASGHGFSISKADNLQKGEWGSVAALTKHPLEQCESLPDTNEREVEDCREGVFNVVSDWMTAQNYGLTFDFVHPFADCDKMIGRWRYACYYEFGQKLQPITGQDVVKAEHLADAIVDKTLREMTFGVMVAGMMQVQAPLGEYHDSAIGCTKISDKLFPICVFSTANGLMEHGAPQEEYKEALKFCSDSALLDRNGHAICYQALEHRLSRFYAPEKKREVCSLFPADMKDECNATQ